MRMAKSEQPLLQNNSDFIAANLEYPLKGAKF